MFATSFRVNIVKESNELQVTSIWEKNQFVCRESIGVIAARCESKFAVEVLRDSKQICMGNKDDKVVQDRELG
jgi:hypothetical protein